ncbi:hypothetical protein KC316_g9704 [Hortaea werneckii]|nr:hypothetical protein KC324_g9681 [Hortaea werneckii]KAI7578819.1 hypothetical protein KC316_g9704 [Hortaea werneckii]
MNTPESVKGSTSKKNSDSSPNNKRGTLEKKGVRYDDQVLPLQETENFLELPRHVDCVRQSLLNFTYSLPSSIDIFDYFEAQCQKLVDKLEVGSYRNWSFFPPSDSEQHSVWWTSAGSYPSRGPDPREIPLWANVEECNQAVKNLKSEHLGVEIDWTERLRSAIFRKYDEKAVEAKDEPQSVSGVPASHEIEPFERWCLARDVWWNEADSFEEESSNGKDLKDPKPDLTYAFPILSAPCTGFAAQETLGTTFSLDVLQELRKDDHIELISAPTTGLKNRSNGSSRKVLNSSDLMCFPWAVVEVKQPRVEKSKVEECYCQAANGSAMALRMLGALFRNATGCVPTDLPPIIAITCVGPELRVWLTYNAGTGGQREDNMNILMKCVYATHLELVWGVHSSRLIVKHMHVWASRILKPRICMYLSLLASKRSLSNHTRPPECSSSDRNKDGEEYSSPDEDSVSPYDSPLGKSSRQQRDGKTALDPKAKASISASSPSREYASRRSKTSTATGSNKRATTPTPSSGCVPKASTPSSDKRSNKKSTLAPRTPQNQIPFKPRQETPSFTPILNRRKEDLASIGDQQTPQKAKKAAVSDFESIGSLEVDALVIELEDLVAKFQKLGVSASSTPIQDTRRSSYYYIRRKALAAITRPSQGHGDDLGPRREPTVEKIFDVEDGWQQLRDLVVGASDYDHGSDVALTLVLASAVVLTVVALTDF